MRLAWATDVHLDWLEPEAVETFLSTVEAAQPDLFLLTGDIGHGDDVAGRLREMAARLARPIAFVLGNHDYYFSSVAAVRREMVALTEAGRSLSWLPAAGVVRLTAETALVGHDGWADGRAGNGTASTVMMNDYLLIGEFTEILAADGPVSTLDASALLDRYAKTQPERFALMARYADEAADHLRRVVAEALEVARHVVVLMHFPPFVASCWYRGAISEANWLPHMVCTSAGEVLRAAMAARPDRSMTVLCGHTHGAGTTQILPNLHVRTGGARYGHPMLQSGLEVT